MTNINNADNYNIVAGIVLSDLSITENEKETLAEALEGIIDTDPRDGITATELNIFATSIGIIEAGETLEDVDGDGDVDINDVMKAMETDSEARDALLLQSIRSALLSGDETTIDALLKELGVSIGALETVLNNQYEGNLGTSLLGGATDAKGLADRTTSALDVFGKIGTNGFDEEDLDTELEDLFGTETTEGDNLQKYIDLLRDLGIGDAIFGEEDPEDFEDFEKAVNGYKEALALQEQIGRDNIQAQISYLRSQISANNKMASDVKGAASSVQSLAESIAEVQKKSLEGDSNTNDV